MSASAIHDLEVAVFVFPGAYDAEDAVVIRPRDDAEVPMLLLIPFQVLEKFAGGGKFDILYCLHLFFFFALFSNTYFFRIVTC